MAAISPQPLATDSLELRVREASIPKTVLTRSTNAGILVPPPTSSILSSLMFF